MVVRIQSRHDITSNWNKENPTLLVGEIGVETDGNKRMKIGNGIDAWQNLPYFDEKFIHTYGEDIIEGLKQFNDNITIGTVAKNANLDVKGNITVSGKVQGLATSAIGDEDGNSIKDCYQKLLSKELEVNDTVDWNQLNETGVYLVNVSSWKLDGTLHQPATYNQYMSRQGLVHVTVDKSGDILQVYTAMKKHASTTVMTQLYRYYKDSAWCDWKSIVAEDDSIVHKTGAESVAGVKSFTDTVNVKDINFTAEADIKMNNQTFIKKNASGDTVLSANGNVILRPNGTTSATGQVVVGADGVLDGKCLRDGEGRVIKDTYATKDSLKHNSSAILEPDFISKSEDEEAYKVLVDRKNNGTETGIDIIREDNYSMKGSVTITEDGVASGFTGKNYLYTEYIPKWTESVILKCSFVLNKPPETNVNHSLFGNYIKNATQPQVKIYNNTMYADISDGSAWLPNPTQVKIENLTWNVNTTYGMELEINGNTAFLRLMNGDDIIKQSQITLTASAGWSNGIVLGTDLATDSFIIGSIDLNSVKIFVDDKLVYTPMLRIPYTQAVNGTKIVNAQYANRVTDCFDQFGTANYFILDETNEQFQLPYDSPTGFNHTLKHYRKGTASYEYDTNLECVQTGTATANTAVTLPKPYADTNYTVSIACTNKTKTGFTPTVSGDYTTKGRITLA